MTPADVWIVLLGTLQGLGVAVTVVLGLLIGFCLLIGLAKLRPSGRSTMVVRSLDEALGRPETYLPASTPRGPVDQLRTPELLEGTARKSG